MLGLWLEEREDAAGLEGRTVGKGLRERERLALIALAKIRVVDERRTVRQLQEDGKARQVEEGPPQTKAARSPTKRVVTAVY